MTTYALQIKHIKFCEQNRLTLLSCFILRWGNYRIQGHLVHSIGKYIERGITQEMLFLFKKGC